MRHTVLVVDDEPAIRLALEMAFEDAGFQVATAGSAEDALALLEERSFDTFLVDKDLPGKSGVEFIRELRTRGNKSPVLMVTGHASVGSAVDTLNLGIDAYLEKPFERVGDVVQLTQTALRRRRASSITGLGRVWRAFGQPAPSTTLRVVVAASTAATRAQLAAAAAGVATAVTEAASSEELLNLAGLAATEIVVLDGALDHDISDLVLDVLARAPSASCVVVSGTLQLATVARLTKLGAKAVVPHAPGSPALGPALAEAIQRIADQRAI